MKNPFTDHPASVGENYFQHLFAASGFSLILLIAAFACLVHAVLPFLFVKTGSQRVTALYRQMVTQRHRRNRLTDGDILEG